MNNAYPPQNQRAAPPPGQRFYASAQQGPRSQYPPQGRGYDQRPPPQRSAQRPPPPRQQPQQQQQPQYYPMQEPVYDNGLGYQQHEEYGAYDNGYYEEHNQYDQGYAPQQYQQDYDQRHDRQYHYDERYRTNGRQPPPQQYQQDYRDHVPPSRVQNGPSEPSREPRERDRILKAQPESPKSVPWDNPFGAFPSKKPPANGRSSRTEDDQGRDTVNSTGPKPRENGIPASQTHQKSGQRPQPQAVNSRRNSGPDNQQTHYPDAHPRKNFSRPPSDNSYRSDRGPPKPLQRAMTEPDFGHQHNEYNPQPAYYDDQTDQFHHRDFDPRSNGQSHDGSYARNGNSYEQSQAHPIQNMPGQPSQSVSQTPSTNRSKYSSYEVSVASKTPSSLYNSPPAATPAVPASGAVDVPNFDNIVSNGNEDQLNSAQTSKPIQPYRKPTYQTPTNATQGTQATIVSSLADFSFDLDPINPSASPAQTTNPRSFNQSHDGPNQPAGYFAESGMGGLPPQTQTQFPPRSASRGNMRPPPRDQYDQPPMPQPGQLMHRDTHDQFNTHGDQGPHGQAPMGQYDNDYQYQSGPPLRRPPPLRDPGRAGYDPRLNHNASTSQISLQKLGGPPPRPMTANSVQLPVNGYGQRASSDSYQMSVRSQSDLASRPVPFRPGLLQPTPPPPQPVETQPLSQAPAPIVSSEFKGPPVTMQELNMIRQSCQASPNDHALGLRYAKKLVEAAKVLSNEGGRADPKQTAKNRERYIMDAHKIIKRLIQTGYTEAMFYMADCYGSGMLGLQADPKEAFSLYQSAAKLGHAQAAYRVAVCCELGPEEGGGTRRDPLKAVQWYKRAASLGDTPAMYKMGMIQLKGLLGQPRSPRDAISWLKRAAERADKENPHALHELGLLYESAKPNDVALRDEPYALQLFTQAAELGYKYSQFRLGSAYEYGLLGCVIDPRMSIAWYSRAAAQGEHQSEFALSGWYLTGGAPPAPGQPALLEQNDTEAYLWARKAASSGLAKAEYAMGYYTEVGIGVASNIEEAKKWYFRAAAQNHPKARQRLEDLRRGGARMQKTRVSRSNVGKQNEGECTVM